MSMLSRRDALGLMTAAGGVTALPGLASAQSADPVYQAFETARHDQDWTLGWVDAPAEGLDGVARRLHGAMPAGLQGVLHRNGPGRFSRDNYRYRHWFDGDGFVHAWQLSEDGVSHRARFVETPKWRMEEEAGRFLMPALASVPPHHGGVRGPDDMNVANTSVMMSDGELLALWEGGSAWRLDPDTLESHGARVWGEGLAGMPFSAHPTRDVDGTVWNFGQDAGGERLVLWQIGPDGHLKKAQMVGDVPGGMIHDFVITDRSLVFLVGGYRFEGFRLPFLDSFRWQAGTPMRAIAFDKDDWSQRRDWELPPGFLFHFGGAWEEPNGTIHLDAALSDDAEFAFDGAYRVMRGEPSPESETQSRLTRVTLGADGRATLDAFGDVFAEFPQIDARLVGQRRKFSWHVGWTDGSGEVSDRIVRRDLQSGQSDSFNYGSGIAVEEALFVPREDATAEGEGWLVHTALNLEAEAMELHVLDAMNLSAGPVGSWRLPYAAPLGFHGCWRSV